MQQWIVSISCASDNICDLICTDLKPITFDFLEMLFKLFLGFVATFYTKLENIGLNFITIVQTLQSVPKRLFKCAALY